MKIAELYAVLGVITDEKKLKDFFNILQDGKKILYGVGAMAVGTSIGIGAMLDKSLRTSIALSNFTAETGLSAQALQMWQHVGEAVGLTADEMTGSIQGLNESLIRAKLFGEKIGTFNLLRINPRQIKNVWELMERLRETIQSGQFEPTLMTGLIRELGGSGAMVRVLLADFNKLSNRQAVIPQEWIERAIKFNAQMKTLGQTITYLFAEAFQELAPTMEDTLRKIQSWIKENQKGIREGIVAFTKIIIAFTTKIGEIGAQIDQVVQKTIGWENALKTIAGLVVAFNPLLRALTLIYLILDLIERFQGPEPAGQKIDKFARGEMGPLSWISGAGFKAGDWLGRNLPTDFLLKPRTDIYRPLLLPERDNDIYKMLDTLREGKSSMMSEINITQHIQSGADAREVAEISVREIKRAISGASLQVALS